jgi:Mg/Co/Ni transporter MgtE
MDHAEPATPLLERQTTLKDAPSLLLSADVLAGVVVDDQKRLLGVVTLDQIAAFLREVAR